MSEPTLICEKCDLVFSEEEGNQVAARFRKTSNAVAMCPICETADEVYAPAATDRAVYELMNEVWRQHGEVGGTPVEILRQATPVFAVNVRLLANIVLGGIGYMLIGMMIAVCFMYTDDEIEAATSEFWRWVLS